MERWQGKSESSYLEKVVAVVRGARADLSIVHDARRQPRGAVEPQQVLLGEVVVRVVVAVHQDVGPPGIRCRFGSTPIAGPIGREVHVGRLQEVFLGPPPQH